MQTFLNFPASDRLWQRLQQGMQPQVLLSSLAAGLVTGVIGVIRGISYASLIFSGALATHLPVGLGMTVFSTAIVAGVVALTSTLPGMIATPLAAPATIMAIMAAAIAQELSGVPDGEVLATVLVAIALGALLTGLMLLGLGLLRQGERIRFVPYPVIGGFMAGTGWLLTKGFIQIVTDISLTPATLLDLSQPEMLVRWLPGLGFAIALLVATRLWKQFWVMPTTLLVCAGLFFLTLEVAQISIPEARAAGWLLGAFPSGQLWHPLTPATLTQVHWWAIAHQSGSLLTVMFVSLLSLLLSNSSIELVVGRDLNLSKEMTAIGLANLASSLGGGMAGNQALPSTLLVHDIGGKYRLSGLIAMVPAIAVLALGSAFLSYLPKAVLGSLILYLGLSLLWQWLYQAYFKLPLSDYLTVWATLIVIDAVGFLQGVALGFVITVILFMVRYSQVDIAKQMLSGDTSRSNVVGRSPEQGQLLSQQGSQIYALELQGYLFFGTANYLLNKVRDRAADTDKPLKYIIIDFRQVSGLDSSAVLTFSKIFKLARQRTMILVLTNLMPEFEAALQRGGVDCSGDWVQVLPDLDRGLEWCEQQLLAAASPPPADSIQDHLIQRFLAPDQAQAFLDYLEPLSLPAGHFIFRPGEMSSELYFIESGQVSVLLELEDGRTKRLQTCSGGQLLGEMRFYNKVPLSSSVVTDTASHVYRLSRESFSRMQQEAPDLVQALQGHIVNILCDSLIRRGEQLRVMQ
ncbi:sodium-independent anion transporter [filamentous cyanobacterium CCP5]|nr:sodium-independent anion transporter [filamentous cyanobacterium CCP5]